MLPQPLGITFQMRLCHADCPVLCPWQCLSDCRDRICRDLGLSPTDVELSMGMSGDFEQAVMEYMAVCWQAVLSNLP